MLTVVQFTLPQGAKKYVNSQWKLQEDPFSGDVANSYTDDGKMGSFYELESSSPAGELHGSDLGALAPYDPPAWQ